MRPALVALVLTLAGPVAHSQDAPVAPVALGCDADEARRRICAVDDSLRWALVAADTAALARLYADDLQTVNYRGVRSTKAGLLRAIGSGALRFDTLLVRRRAAEVRGDTGVVSGSMHQVPRGPDGAHPLEVNYVRVYVRHVDGWRLVRATIRAADQPPNDSLRLTARPRLSREPTAPRGPLPS